MMADKLAEAIDASDDPAKELGNLEVWNGKKRYVLRNANGHFVTWRKLRMAERTQTNRAMADGGIPDSQDVELTIVYLPETQDDEEEVETIDATINVDKNDWEIVTEVWEDGKTWRVVDDRDKIHVAPVDPYDLGNDEPVTTSSADYTPGSNRMEPSGTEHDGRYIKSIAAPEISETLGQIVADAREEYQNKRGIKPVNELAIDIPEIEFEVQEGTPQFPSSKSGQTMAPREALVVDPVEEDEAYDRWHDAIVETTNRYQVWTGTPHKGTDDLLAPPKAEAGDRMSLGEYLDAWYTVDPQSVADAVESPEVVAEKEAKKSKKNEILSQHPELRRVSIDNLDAFDEAQDAGEQVVIGDSTSDCNDDGKQCNLDIITYIATPDGDVETTRTHTY